MNKFTKNKGFTLVEFIIYFAATTSILSILILSFINLMDARENAKAKMEISTYGKYVTETFIREIEPAYEILDPVLYNSTFEITYRVSGVTIIEEVSSFLSRRLFLQGGKLFLDEIDDVTVTNTRRLTPDTFIIKDLNFSRLSAHQFLIEFLIEYTGYGAYDKLNQEKFRLVINSKMSI